jgi:D-3-phosphoglycerate dehydrogenase
LLELLRIADVITLHVPENESTKNLMGPNELAQLQQTCVLINTARGNVVDLSSLESALDHGRLKGAALDVFPREPRSEDEPFENPLRRFDNVLLTPHIGGSTIEAQENIGREVAEKLAKYSDQGSTVSAVNFPEVALAAHPDNTGSAHPSQSPGVLSEINRVFLKLDQHLGPILQTPRLTS